jgi:CTP synthase (UTP-ammonia lyase)
MNKKIAIIGEFHNNFRPHSDLINSIEHVKTKLNLDIEYEWIDTLRAEKEGDKLFSKFTGFWSAPGSPFKSLNGAINAIKYARTNDIPHLGTCAGFQHTVIEFVRNVLKITGAQHAEYDNDSSVLFISRLACSLAGKKMKVQLIGNTLTSDCYKSNETIEDYYCNFGINPEFTHKLEHADLIVSGIDQDGEIRIIEIPKNRFFISTLFVPQTNSTIAKTHPIIERFVLECLK